MTLLAHPEGAIPPAAPRGRSRASGYALVALMAAIAVMLVALSAATPSWRYVVKNDREEELIFRGSEIADAVGRYQRRNGNALPPSLDVLVKGKYLRRAYKDPMTKSGHWRFVRPGEALPGSTNALTGNRYGSSTTTTTTTTRPSAFGPGGTVVGGFQGVASTSSDKSLRLFNGRSRYDEWVFAPGLPRIIGRPLGTPSGAPGAGSGSRQGTPSPYAPGSMPTPSPLGPAGNPSLPGATPLVAPQSQPYVVPP